MAVERRRRIARQGRRLESVQRPERTERACNVVERDVGVGGDVPVLSVQAFEEIGLNERFVTDLESAASNLKESRNQIHAVR